jgi:hypothetical protein
VRGQQLAQHRLARLSPPFVVAVDHARDAAVAGDDQMGDGAGRSVELRHVRRRDARQLSVRDDLAAERGEAQGGAVAAAAVAGLLDVPVRGEAQQETSRGTRVNLQGSRDLGTGEVIEGQQLERLQCATGVVGLRRCVSDGRRFRERAFGVGDRGHSDGGGVKS